MKSKGFERILLATDASDEARAAEAVAVSFAEPTGATVRVVHVWNMEVRHRHGYWDIETRREAEALITDTVKRLRASGVDADGELCHADNDHIAAAVAASGQRFGADLVVVGARGLSDLQSLVQHSVSHQLLHSVDCPVLVVRGNSSGSGHSGQRVLLAVAGADDVGPAVHAAIGAAATPGSRVLVLHVAQAIFGAFGVAYVEPNEAVESTVSTATAMLREAGIQTEAFVARGGSVSGVIADTAARWEADVIVIGSSRMGDIASIVFGSVTHQLLRGVGRPVLIAERARA